MTFLRSFSVNAGATGLTFALAFANQSWIARRLGAEGLGELALAATTATVAGMVFGEWLARGNGYHAGRDPARSGAVWRNTAVYCAAMLPLFLGAAAVLASLGAGRASMERALLMAAMGAGVVAQKGFSGILQGRDRLTAYALVPLLFISAYLLLNLVAIGWLRAGVTGVLTAWLGGVCVASLAAAVLSRSAGAVDGTLLRATAAVGSRGAVSATLIYLLFRSDVYLVEAYLGAEALGVYYVAVFIAEMLQRGPNIAGAVLLPKVLRGGDDDHGVSLTVSRWVFLFSLLAVAGVVAVGRPLIVSTFGPAYAGAYQPLVWMLPGLVATGYGSVLNTKLAAQGYPPVTMWAPAAALAVNIALNLAWIPRLGLVGAALATSAAYALWAAVVTVAYGRATGVTLRQLVGGRAQG